MSPCNVGTCENKNFNIFGIKLLGLFGKAVTMSQMQDISKLYKQL
jgi:hypothetical protein